MKIEVTYIRRKNFVGPIYVSSEIIRVPSDIKNLNRETINKLLKERNNRRDYIRENSTHKNIHDKKENVMISWSPIIDQRTLDFICSNL